MSATNDFFKEVKGLFEDFDSLREENKRLKEEVAFLKRADRHVCWNNQTKRWEVRFEEPKVKDNYHRPQ